MLWQKDYSWRAYTREGEKMTNLDNQIKQIEKIVCSLSREELKELFADYEDTFRDLLIYAAVGHGMVPEDFE
jgi:hypothetical protein